MEFFVEGLPESITQSFQWYWNSYKPAHSRSLRIMHWLQRTCKEQHAKGISPTTKRTFMSNWKIVITVSAEGRLIASDRRLTSVQDDRAVEAERKFPQWIMQAQRLLTKSTPLLATQSFWTALIAHHSKGSASRSHIKFQNVHSSSCRDKPAWPIAGSKTPGCYSTIICDRSGWNVNDQFHHDSLIDSRNRWWSIRPQCTTILSMGWQGVSHQRVSQRKIRMSSQGAPGPIPV